jgi:protein-tyrosine phosphatase
VSGSVAKSKPVPARPRPLVSRLLTQVLRHPLTMAIKRRLRDVRWALARPAPENPPMPDRVDALLFVCLGNICRSPFAGVLADQRLRQTGRGHVRSLSAGIRPSQAAKPPYEAVEAARAFGVSLGSHVPQGLTPELVAAHDLVIVMEAVQLDHLRATYPEHARRFVLLSLFDDGAAGRYERFNIADPFGQSRDAFDACYHRIARAVTALLAALPTVTPAAAGAASKPGESPS